MEENKILKNAAQWILALFIAIIVVFLVRSFLFSTVRVKGVSMEPTFHHGDMVIVNQISYRFQKPAYGDIIICTYDGQKEDVIIKRVIGLPGDVIELEEDRYNGELRFQVVRNGELLEEPYINDIMQQNGDLEYPYQVPDNCYFVMGDNRNLSSDSRQKAVGAIPKKFIRGKVMGVLPF